MYRNDDTSTVCPTIRPIIQFLEALKSPQISSILGRVQNTKTDDRDIIITRLMAVMRLANCATHSIHDDQSWYIVRSVHKSVAEAVEYADKFYMFGITNFIESAVQSVKYAMFYALDSHSSEDRNKVIRKLLTNGAIEFINSVCRANPAPLRAPSNTISPPLIN